MIGVLRARGPRDWLSCLQPLSGITNITHLCLRGLGCLTQPCEKAWVMSPCSRASVAMTFITTHKHYLMSLNIDVWKEGNQILEFRMLDLFWTGPRWSCSLVIQVCLCFGAFFFFGRYYVLLFALDFQCKKLQKEKV